MTKKRQARVRVWHPGYRAVAHPLRADLKKWIDQGWQVQPATKGKEQQK
jgi:hypothetical protein